MQMGMVGLGRMGANMVRRLVRPRARLAHSSKSLVASSATMRPISVRTCSSCSDATSGALGAGNGRACRRELTSMFRPLACHVTGERSEV